MVFIYYGVVGFVLVWVVLLFVWWFGFGWWVFGIGLIVVGVGGVVLCSHRGCCVVLV